MIEDHPRLLRSMDFNNDDYEGNSLQVLSGLISENNANLVEIVVSITQSVADIPFDLRHHRALTYLPNAEGLAKLEADLEKKLVKVFN